MVPIWPQLGSPNGAKMAKKIDPKLDHFFDVSWDRCLGGIWWIFGAKMEVSWHQNGIKNWCLLGRAIFLKSCSGCSGRYKNDVFALSALKHCQEIISTMVDDTWYMIKCYMIVDVWYMIHIWFTRWDRSKVWKERHPTACLPFARKSRPHGSILASKIDPK